MTYHLFSMTTRRAAKPHRCIWCGQAIAKGETYQDERSVYEGSHQLHRWHPECHQDAQECLADGDDPEFIPHSAERPATNTEA